MKISIISLFPSMIEGFITESIVKRAQEKGLVEIEVINPREFALDRYGTVDGKPYGGGTGMVMRVEPIVSSLRKAQAKTAVQSKIIVTSPRGIVFNQKKAKEYSRQEQLIIIAGHYEGLDERCLEYADEEISIGDFVMTGGEIATAAIVDSVVRLLPGVLKKENATEVESFFEVDIDELLKAVGHNEQLITLKRQGSKKVRLLEYPQYTRPEDYEGKTVPSILLSGNHAEVKAWQLKKAFEQTAAKRPDLLQ